MVFCDVACREMHFDRLVDNVLKAMMESVFRVGSSLGLLMWIGVIMLKDGVDGVVSWMRSINIDVKQTSNKYKNSHHEASKSNIEILDEKN